MARVIGWLRRDEVDVVFNNDNSPMAVPSDLFPSELRHPNAEIWVVCSSGKVIAILPRHCGEHPPKDGLGKNT